MIGWIFAWWLAYEWEMEERRMRLTEKQFKALAEANPALRPQLEEAGMVKPLSPTGRLPYDPPIQTIGTKTGRLSYTDPPRANIPKWMRPEDKIEIRYLLKGLALKGLGAILGSQAIKKSARDALDKAEPYGKDTRPR